MMDTDPCDTIYCAHGGTCDDGECDCVDPYTGPTCEELKVAHSVRFTGAKVVSYPVNRPNGNSWDNGSLPDLAVLIFVNGNRRQWSYYVPDTPFETTFSLNNTENSYDVEDQVRVEVVDVDGNNYEVVGSYVFHPSDWGPLYYGIELYDANTEHQIRMWVYVEWVF